MRTFLVISTFAVIVATGGCASQSGSAGYRETSSRDERGVLHQDDEYIALVERSAARRGVSVEWVHPPFKRVRSDKTAPARQTDGG